MCIAGPSHQLQQSMKVFNNIFNLFHHALHVVLYFPSFTCTSSVFSDAHLFTFSFSTSHGSTDQLELGWRCPGCQNPSTTIPSVYKCFCGKVANPERKRDSSTPHSCGELCGRKLATSAESLCHHRCQLLCHPGPCPPCPVMVLRSCFCGRTR